MRLVKVSETWWVTVYADIDSAKRFPVYVVGRPMCDYCRKNRADYILKGKCVAKIADRERETVVYLCEKCFNKLNTV